MLHHSRIFLSVSLDAEDFGKVTSKLADLGWPSVRATLETQYKTLAGLDADVQLRRSRPGPSVQRGEVAELFFETEALLYINAQVSHRPIEIGVVSANGADLSHLWRLCKALFTAIGSEIDGRKTRHMQFEWTAATPGQNHLGRLKKRFEDEGIDLAFTEAGLIEGEIIAARVLAQQQTRETLRDIAAAGFVLQHDILARRKSTEEIEAIIQELGDAGLINTEFLLQCRKTSAPLTRIASKDVLEGPEMAGLTCPSCGASFKEENPSEGFGISDLGRRLSDSSHWMTVLVTDELVAQGVPLNAILWGLSESGEEIDIVVEFLESLWIFELKDRDFGAGDAYPFSYRRSRYRADSAVIVTCGRIGEDAKRVFEDQNTDTRQRPTERPPLYVEGLNELRPKLQEQIENRRLIAAWQALRTAEEVTGFDVVTPLRRFAEFPPRD